MYHRRKVVEADPTASLAEDEVVGSDQLLLLTKGFCASKDY